MEKIRLLAWGDYCCNTGFGIVMSNILSELYSTGRYEIDVVAINYDGGPYDPERYPGRVWPALSGIRMQGNYADVFGRQIVLDRLAQQEYDVIFMIQDTFIVQGFMPQLQEALAANPAKTKAVYYFPIDAPPKKDWIKQVVTPMGYPVAYTNYAKEECAKINPELEGKLKVIYHGTNVKDFYPIDNYAENKAFREQYFQFKADGKFLLTNVNRNQARKDIARNFAIIRELKDRGYDDFLLYMHMMHNDVGGNLLVMADNFGLKHGVDFLFPNPALFSPDKGLDVTVLNRIYNCSDAVLTTTLGEGWGLSITEGMAVKKPVLAPDHTSCAEILADNRGILMKSGGKSLWITKESDNERVRPLLDVEDAADKIISLREGKSVPDIEAAYTWVQDHTWKNIVGSWQETVEAAALAAKADREVAEEPKLNRAQRRALKKAT